MPERPSLAAGTASPDEVPDLDGLQTSRIRNLTVSDSQFTGVIGKDRVRHAEVAWRGVTVNGQAVR